MTDTRMPIAYAVRNVDGYWIGIWRERETAELVASKAIAAHHEIVVPLYAAPDDEIAVQPKEI